MLPDRLIVEVDTREKYPVLFPATIKISNKFTQYKNIVYPIDVVHTRLFYGDYRLAEYPTYCVIERKASRQELVKNLFDPADSLRCTRAFTRLADNCSNPYILIETSLSEFFTDKNNDGIDSDSLLHRLYLQAAYHNLGILWAPRASNRRQLGGNLLHLMVAHAVVQGQVISDFQLTNVPQTG